MSNQVEVHLHLNSIEEDDEFEDFDIKGMGLWFKFLDWADAKPNSTMDASLWTQDWDDDVLDDEFSTQLREELNRMSNGN